MTTLPQFPASSIVTDAELDTALDSVVSGSGHLYIGTTDPATVLTVGTEYVWHKTDGSGTLIDIITGVA